MKDSIGIIVVVLLVVAGGLVAWLTLGTQRKQEDPLLGVVGMGLGAGVGIVTSEELNKTVRATGENVFDSIDNIVDEAGATVREALDSAGDAIENAADNVGTALATLFGGGR